jgi:uncharacterized protein YegL
MMMRRKTIIFVLCLLFSGLHLNAQGGFIYEILVKNSSGGTVRNLEVWIVRGSDGKKIQKNTGPSGKVTFQFTPGLWTLNLPGMLKYKEIMVNPGARGRGSMTITYAPELIKREKAFIEMRALTTFDTIDATGTDFYIYKQGHYNMIVKVQTKKNQPLKDMYVALVSPELEKIFVNRTNAAGEASFLVPDEVEYGVDVDEVKDYTITERISDATLHRVNITYEPARIFQIVRNDSTWQKPENSFEPTSTHASLSLLVKDVSGNPLPNEEVHLNQIIGCQVYTTRTNDKGRAMFLLPKGDKYMIHFEYQHDVDVIDLRQSRGYVRYDGQVTYRPDKRLQYPEYFIPSSEELLLEEFNNFITKQLPSPTDSAVGLYLNWGNRNVTVDSREAILELGIAVTEKENYKNVSPPANLAFVLDRSGSMAGDARVESLKKSLMDFISELRQEDAITLVSFNQYPYIEYPLKRIENMEELEEIVTSISPAGGTNIYNGLMTGFQQLLDNYDENKTNHLILLTDGFGITEPRLVVDTAFYFINKKIGFSAIGVGQNYNYALLSLLTSKGAGLLRHSGNPDKLYDDFNEKLKQLIYPVARNARIEITYNNHVEYNHLFGYDVDSIYNNKVVFDIGDLYAGQNKIAMAQFRLNQPDSTIENKPVSIKISYFDLLKKEQIVIKNNVSLDWQDYTGEKEIIIDNHLKKLYAVAIMNQSLKAMSDAFEEDNVKEAAYRLERVSGQLKELFPNAMDADLERISGKMASYLKNLERVAEKRGISL